MIPSEEPSKLRLAPVEPCPEAGVRCPPENSRSESAVPSASVQTLAPFRVGSVPYLNAVPLTYGLEKEIAFVPPSRLAEQLRRDELDAALVSVVEVLLADRYDILDGVAIASLGEVKSVFLAHRRPLEEITEIFCDTASLTSTQLLRVLLAERGLHATFRPFEVHGSPERMPDAVMLIGNQALDFLLAPHEHMIWDLGAAWYELTNLPFVYAVWALRRGLENKRLCRQLRETKEFGLEMLDHIIRSRPEYDFAFRKDYLSWHVHFHLGDDERRGLTRFVELLRKHLPVPVYEPRFVH